MIEHNDKTKRHFIRGIVVKRDTNFYAPLIQVVKFCHRFPNVSAKAIGDIINEAINELKSNKELLSTIPEVKDVKELDGGINGSTKKETKKETEST